MDRPLEVRPVESYPRPAYPGVPAPPGFQERRYSPGMLQRFARGLARPFVLLGLYTTLNLSSLRAQETSGGNDGAQDVGPKDPRRGDDDGRTRVSTGRTLLLSREEVRELVCGLDEVIEEFDPQPAGFVIGPRSSLSSLTEEEGRKLLKAFFRKNGFEIEDDVPIRHRAVEFKVDGYDASRAVGFEYLEEEGLVNDPPEPDLRPDEVKELELASVRGERAILVLDGAQYHYGYNLDSKDVLLSKAAAVDRLLDDVRRFAEWLEAEGRLHPIADARTPPAKDE